MLGTIGEKERMESTVISDAVNLASRMENLTKTYNTPILIIEISFPRLTYPDMYNYRLLDRVQVIVPRFRAESVHMISRVSVELNVPFF